MAGTNPEGTAPSTDRARQPGRVGGGNTFENSLEKHDQSKAKQIGIQGIGGHKAGGENTDTGKKATDTRLERSCGGNSANSPEGEKHGSSRGHMGREYVEHYNGPEIARKGSIPSRIEIVERGEYKHGNDDAGKHEKISQKKGERINLGKHRLGENE